MRIGQPYYSNPPLIGLTNQVLLGRISEIKALDQLLGVLFYFSQSIFFPLV